MLDLFHGTYINCVLRIDFQQAVDIPMGTYCTPTGKFKFVLECKRIHFEPSIRQIDGWK